MRTPDFSTAWRVVCPDGTTVEVFIDEADAEKTAQATAKWADRTHDEAICTRPHIIERAEWVRVRR